MSIDVLGIVGVAAITVICYLVGIACPRRRAEDRMENDGDVKIRYRPVGWK